MAIQEFNTESEIDDAFERIEELAFEHLSLKEAVEEKRKELEEVEKELSDFEENYPEAL